MEKKNILIVLALAVVLWIAAVIFGPEIERVSRIRAEGIIKIFAILILGATACYHYFLGTKALRSKQSEWMHPPVSTNANEAFPAVESAEFLLRSTPTLGSPSIASLANQSSDGLVAFDATGLHAPIVDETYFPADTSASLVIPGFADCADDQTLETLWGESSGLNFDSEIDLFDEQDVASMEEFLESQLLAV